MADKSAGLTTEQLLMELGRVVMGLGTKIDSLGEKLDAIHTVLSEEKPAVTGETGAATDLSPVLDRLDAIHGVLSASPAVAEGETAVQPGAAPFDNQPLLLKLDELKEAIKEIRTAGPVPPDDANPEKVDLDPLLSKLDELKDALREMKAGEALPVDGQPGEQLDLAPLLAKFDEIRTSLEDMKVFDEFKPLLEALALSVDKMPETMIDGVQKNFEVLHEKLESLQKTAEDREFVGKITDSVDGVKSLIETSGSDVAVALREIPQKLEGIGGDISDAMNDLKEKTSDLMEKTQESLSSSEEALASIKDELQKGLKLNTEMTGQMVDLTSRFADRAQEDRIVDLNSRAVGHFNRGEYSEAAELYKEAIEISPENPELLCNYGHVLSAQGDVKKAEELFRKALGSSPELEPALSGLGMIMVSTGRAEETIEFLKSTILSGEPAVKTTIAYTRALVSLERHDEAVELLEAALRGSPDNPEIMDELKRYGYEENQK